MSSDFARRFLAAMAGEWGSVPVNTERVEDAFVTLKMWLWELYGEEKISQEQFRQSRQSLDQLMSLPGGPGDGLVMALDEATRKLHVDEP